MTKKRRTAFKPSQEHSVPWFWPRSAAIELEEEGLRLFQDNLAFVVETEELAASPRPKWATTNRTTLDLDTMRLRDFTHHSTNRTTVPVLIDAPYAGHDSSIADYAKGQSLVETLNSALGRKLDLKAIQVPLYLLAGEADDITTKEQVFNAEMLVGTHTDEVVKKLVPGGHIGLFMGSPTLSDAWPEIGRWIREHDGPDRARRTVR